MIVPGGWLVLAAPAALATDWLGADFAGGDLRLDDGDTLTGTFTGVDRLEVPAHATVIAIDLVVEAAEIAVDGALHADGTGLPSGDGSGAGMGPLGGSYGAAGGGGGGHGGAGGAGGAGDADESPAPGGPPVGGPDALPPAPGSGGGPGRGTVGGAGGGALHLIAGTITVGAAGRIGADGDPGGSDGTHSGGGGGAGGAIRLEAVSLTLWGELSARGGDGGDGGTLVYPFPVAAGGGGGGGGGRVAVVGAITGSPRLDVGGGLGGVGGAGLWEAAADGAPGQPGSWLHVEPVCDDADLDGICDPDDRCEGDDASGDADGDGWCAGDVLGRAVDCDDADPVRYPGAPERCNGLDDACVGRLPADEADLDGDGVSICEGDCDDLDPQDECGRGAVDEARGCGCAATPTSGWGDLVAGLLRRRGPWGCSSRNVTP